LCDLWDFWSNNCLNTEEYPGLAGEDHLCAFGHHAESCGAQADSSDMTMPIVCRIHLPIRKDRLWTFAVLLWSLDRNLFH